MIRLGFCFDLLDPKHVRDMGRFYQEYKKGMEEAGSPLPVNVLAKKRLNRRVFEFAYEALENRGEAVDTCRAVFVPTNKADRVWPASGINAHAHIQVCVRNVDCILGTWLVKPTEDDADG